MIERQFAEIKRKQERTVWLFWLHSVWAQNYDALEGGQ